MALNMCITARVVNAAPSYSGKAEFCLPLQPAKRVSSASSASRFEFKPGPEEQAGLIRKRWTCSVMEYGNEPTQRRSIGAG